MNEKFEFWPDPTYEEAWWSNITTTVKRLAELLASRPQVKKPEPPKKLDAIEIQGTMTQTNFPKATIIANERLFCMSDTARWLGVSRSYLEKKMKQGLLTS